MGIIADGMLLDVLRKLACFGIHLVKLDIRQDGERHGQVFSELTRYLGVGDYAEWSEEDKQAFLLRELNSRRPSSRATGIPVPRPARPSTPVASSPSTTPMRSASTSSPWPVPRPMSWRSSCC